MVRLLLEDLLTRQEAGEMSGRLPAEGRAGGQTHRYSAGSVCAAPRAPASDGGVS